MATVQVRYIVHDVDAAVEDPSGNPVELFEPLLPEARLQRGDGE